MEYVKGHLKKNLSKWSNKKWYHQRFDGSPYFLYIIGETETREEPRKINGHFTVHYCFFKEGRADWYIELKDIERVYTAIINAGKENPNISEELMQSWKDDEIKFYYFCNRIKSLQLNLMNNEELIQLHDNFIDIIVDRHTSSSLIDGFALGTDEILAKQIQEVYNNSNLKEKIRPTEMFSTLTAPVHLSFINNAEIEMLKIALEVKEHPERREKLLKEYQKHFFWTRNNYIDVKVLDIKHFNEELNKVLSLNIDLKDDIKKIIDTPKINKEKKVSLMKQLDLSDELKLLIKVSEDFTDWQDERKKVTFWTTHYCSLILNEISTRTNIPFKELEFMSPREISKVFQNPRDRNILQERMKECVFYWDQEGYECLYGNDVKEVKDAILEKEDFSNVDDFRGLTASMGKARGSVKVLKSVNEMDKVEKGDILVAVMTRPDYVPAMKKASAIITDEGGVTCHAAIVARELGIPCIIGTKIATKVLKDNMQVEVNANHSWVRILKK
jgi:phosphohistidine swiveling domain-containing protein